MVPADDPDDKLHVIGGTSDNCYEDCKVDVLELDEEACLHTSSLD
jgi:hypothetical protein